MERRQSNVAAATNAADAGEIAIRKTRDYEVCVRIAASLPDYFTPAGVEMVRADVPRGDLYGAFVADQLVGFALYKVLNAEAVELAWLAVDRRHWSRGVGTRLVTTSLAALPAQYRACQVKTLAATAADEGYARTRRFYAELGFIPLEIIDPYPGWDPGNPCQILVRLLASQSPPPGQLRDGAGGGAAVGDGGVALSNGGVVTVTRRKQDQLVPAAAAAVFSDAGELLLIRRLNGKWALPGGVMELGESIEETAIRETLEETGMEVAVERPVGIYSHPRFSPPEHTWQVVGMVFLCRVTGGSLRPSQETLDCSFFPLDHLPEDIAPYHVRRIGDALAAREGAPFVVR